MPTDANGRPMDYETFEEKRPAPSLPEDVARVVRYNVDVEKNANGYWEGVLTVSANGEWVRYPDYQSLSSQLAEMRAERDEVRHEYMLLNMERRGLDLAYAEADRDHLAAENERLREALRDIVAGNKITAFMGTEDQTHADGPWAMIARTALTGKAGEA